MKQYNKNKKKPTLKEQKKLFEEQLVNRFLAVLTMEGARWVKDWQGPSMAPFNGATKHKYKGINRFMLALVAMGYKYDDPRWFTFNQICDSKGYYHKGKKWHLKKGSKCVYVEYYYPYDTEERKNLTWSEYTKLIKDEGRKPEEFFLKVKYSAVFNACQIEGIEPFNADDIPTYDSEPNETILDLAQKMKVDVAFDGGDDAYYSPKEDKIHLPKAEHFFSSEAWASTALHELGHASGSENRLNRPGIVKNTSFFGDEEYAFEELIAEISCCLMCYNLGIEESDKHIENHQAYVASWIKHIKEKPVALTKAIKEAQKVCDYMTALLGDCESPPDDESEVILDVA